MTKLVDTLKSDQDEKMKNLTSNVVLKQSEVQKKVDEHIGDSRDEFSVFKEDIATLRKEMEENNLENMNYFAKIVNTVNKDLDEKIKNLTNNVEIIQSELRETILSVDNNASILAEQLVKHSNRLDALHSNIQDFSGKTSAIQSDINKVMSTANINNGLLGGHDSRLDDLNAKFSATNSRGKFNRQYTIEYTLKDSIKVWTEIIVDSFDFISVSLFDLAIKLFSGN
ncbi:unnamed protein product [Mytilus edulis]|uniref:Uncharacterized protein n=1 Tax=Mytilus edulis TaxID=6550 RepID=A0A8S3SX52_MYTED|nr:unnamed protein product [Mytilus edulis]